MATVSTPAPAGQFQWKADHEQRSELLAAVRDGYAERGADLLTLLPHAPEEHGDALAETPASPESPAIGIDHLSQLHDRLHSTGMSERAEALSFISQTLGVRVHSRKELTLDQWRTVMDALAPGQATAKAG